MDGGIYMSKQGQFVYQAVLDFLNGTLSRQETAKLLQVRERTVSRIARRIEAKGLLGVVHGNRSRVPWNRKHDGLKSEVLRLVQQHYFDFNVTHCREKLKQEHGIEIG